VTTPDPRELRHIAEQMVRHIAAGTGLTTIATIGLSVDGMPVATRTAFSARRLDASYEALLDVAARMQRHHPRGVPAYACALILPERDVAYLHHHDTGNALAQVLTIGRNPVHDPATQTGVSRGLAALMRALADTQPQHRPTGRAFLNDPTAQAVLLPPMPAEHPTGHHGQHR
jgi:hypothetical protein